MFLLRASSKSLQTPGRRWSTSFVTTLVSRTFCHSDSSWSRMDWWTNYTSLLLGSKEPIATYVCFLQFSSATAFEPQPISLFLHRHTQRFCKRILATQLDIQDVSFLSLSFPLFSHKSFIVFLYILYLLIFCIYNTLGLIPNTTKNKTKCYQTNYTQIFDKMQTFYWPACL